MTSGKGWCYTSSKKDEPPVSTYLQATCEKHGIYCQVELVVAYYLHLQSIGFNGMVTVKKNKQEQIPRVQLCNDTVHVHQEISNCKQSQAPYDLLCSFHTVFIIFFVCSILSVSSSQQSKKGMFSFLRSCVWCLCRFCMCDDCCWSLLFCLHVWSHIVNKRKLDGGQ